MARTQTQSRTKIDPVLKSMLWQKYGKRCAHCGRSLENFADCTIEHVIPLHKGGTNDAENLVCLCRDCNQAKSDDVLMPSSYYGYLPKEKIRQLDKLIHDFCDDVYWLSYDNLFKFDQFDLAVDMPVAVSGRGHIVSSAVRMPVRRLRRDEILPRLLPYTARLAPEDKDLMPMLPDEVRLPYYEISYKGKYIMIFSAFMEDRTQSYSVKNGKDEKDGRTVKDITAKTLVFQPFVNPDLKDRKRLTDIMLFNIAQMLLLHIQETLSAVTRPAIVPGIIEAPYSDRYARRLIHAMYGETEKSFPSEPYIVNHNDSDYPPRVLSLDFNMRAGCTHEIARGIFKDINSQATAKDSVERYADYIAEGDKVVSEHIEGAKPIPNKAAQKRLQILERREQSKPRPNPKQSHAHTAKHRRRGKKY